MRRTFALLAALLAATAPLSAELRLPHVFSDHAVLQRDQPLHVWGWADTGTVVHLRFHDQTAEATADRLGRWSAWLKPERAGGPYTLTVDGNGHATITDLLVGDVWLASGQSNMEFPLKGFSSAPLKDSAQEVRNATQPRIRLLLLRKRPSPLPMDDVADTWTTCTPETAADFSAIAYFFGREISTREKVPIGLIDSTWGGTPADSWVSMNSLATDGNLQTAFAARASFADDAADFPAVVTAEIREDAEAIAAGRKPAKHAWHPAVEQAFAPAALYNGMIAPLTPMQLKGFLWYQGETNGQAQRAPYYRTLMPALIADWRMHFAQGSLPFLLVQISSFATDQDFGLVREAQRRTLALRDTAMAVTLDVGDPSNIHPPDKQTVAARLALAARSTVYGDSVAGLSPEFRMATTEGAAMRVYFEHAQGLTARGQPLGDFELDGGDGNFVPAEARLEGDSVVVHAAGVPHPRAVRYAWTSVVTHYLYNAAGLPLGTFTSEALPMK